MYSDLTWSFAMTLSKRAAALTAGLAVVLASAILPSTLSAQQPRAKSEGETLVLDDATVAWIEKSRVAALREGVIERMELQIGMPVKKGKPIGYLHAELAELTVAKSKLAAKSEGPKAEAKAKQELALTTVAVNERLNQKNRGLVSYEEQRKAEAEVKVATAMYQQAEEKVKLDEAELALAERALEEHKIIAPFDGVIIDRMKHPGERVGANEAVVVLGNLDKLRVYAFVPLQNSYQVKEGQIVELQLKVSDRRNREPLAIEQKHFRGKITFVDTEIQPVGEIAVRIYADFDNKEHELRPGHKGTLTIFLNSVNAATTEARNDPGAVGR